MIEKIEFKNQKKETLRGFIHKPKSYKDAVVLLHGFPGSCNGKTGPRLAKALEKCGFLVMRFDFSGTDISDGKFEDKLISQEVKEVKFAIDFLEKNYKFRKLTLVGHSTGAIIACLYAYKDKRINKVVLSGCVNDLNKSVRYDFTDLQVKDFWTKGFITYKRPDVPKHWVHNKKLKKQYYDEFFKLDNVKSLQKYKRPLLFVHGEKDEAVPLEVAKDMFEKANSPKRMVVIKNADHSYTKRIWGLKLIKTINNFLKN